MQPPTDLDLLAAFWSSVLEILPALTCWARQLTRGMWTFVTNEKEVVQIFPEIIRSILSVAQRSTAYHVY